MAISQLKFYSSGDTGAPQLTGLSGSMLAILDACLVNGYGSKQSAGWIKPFANTASAGAWTQPSGSGFSFCVYDNGSTNGGINNVECLVQGWESIVAITGSNPTSSGIGYGAFPYPLQTAPSANGGPTSSSLTIRKSGTFDATPQYWMMFADAYTLYFFHWTYERGCYKMFGFGDIFSLSTNPDKYKCMITGESGVGNQDGRWYPWDNMFGATFSGGSSGGLPNWFIARGAGGTGTPRYFYPVGDMGKQAVGTGGLNNYINGSGGIDTNRGILGGYLPCPNIDNSVYVCPLWVGETMNSYVLRGRMRGLYHLCHQPSNFSDGQIVTGANEYAGKSFQVVKPGYYGGAMLIEISNTVETNDN